MKLHSLFFNIIILVFVLVFCVFPPLLPVFTATPAANDFTTWSFPFQQFSYFILAFGIYLISGEIKQRQISRINFTNKKHYFFYKIFTPFLFTFAFLFFNSLIFSFISTLDIFQNQTDIKVQLPADFSQWIFCILNFGFAAFYEEVIYRFYLIERLNITFNSKNKLALKIIFEVIGTILFALGHFYLGVLSVLNAAIAHLILRLCFKKSGNIYCGFAAHFAYNMISLILL